VFFVESILRLTLVEMERLGIRRILTHSEAAAAYMADGYARACGRPGLCFAQSVGAANLAAGLQDAWLGRSPVIALTATTTDADRQLCMDAGMDDFLAKPYKLEQLAQVLGRWIGRPAATSGSERQGLAKLQVGVDGPDHEGVQRMT